MSKDGYPGISLTYPIKSDILDRESSPMNLDSLGFPDFSVSSKRPGGLTSLPPAISSPKGGIPCGSQQKSMGFYGKKHAETMCFKGKTG